MDQAVQTPFGQFGDARLLPANDLIQLVGAKGDDPDFSVRDIDAVRTIEVRSRGDLLRFVVHDLPHRVCARSFETVRAGFHAAVGHVDRFSVRRDVVEERASRNLDLAFGLAGLAIEFSYDCEIGDIQIVAEDAEPFRGVEEDVGLCRVDPLQIDLHRVRIDARDESIVVGRERLAVDVADEVHVLVGVVEHGAHSECSR